MARGGATMRPFQSSARSRGIVRGDASDLVLPESADEYKSLGRRMGYRQADRATDAARLASDIRETMAKVHAYFVARFKSV